MKARVEKFAAELGSDIVLPCDVANDDDITGLFELLGNHWDSLDALVHSIAFAPREALAGDYLENLDREGFRMAHDISSYSLAAMAKAGRAMMQNTNGAIITMTYLGSERALPNYNIMGVAKAALESSVRYLARDFGPQDIRVNAISAGPIRTLAAAGIYGFRDMYGRFLATAPLKQHITTEDVGGSAVFLSSDLASKSTGEVLFVDGGFNIIGMPESPEKE